MLINVDTTPLSNNMLVVLGQIAGWIETWANDENDVILISLKMEKTMDINSEINKAGERSLDSVNSQIKDKSANIHNAIDKASQTTYPAVEKVVNGAHAGVDQVSTALTDATTTLSERTRELTAAYQRYAETGRRYVRTSPVLSVSVALAAGYLCSKLFSSKDH